MLEKAKERLKALGVTLETEDDGLLGLCVEKAGDYMRSFCNISVIHDGLLGAGADMACGEFLLIKKSCGGLSGFDLDAAVKQVAEGKTSVTFAIGEGSQTPEQRLDALIDYLINGHKGELTAYRRLRW